MKKVLILLPTTLLKQLSKLCCGVVVASIFISCSPNTEVSYTAFEAPQRGVKKLFGIKFLLRDLEMAIHLMILLKRISLEHTLGLSLKIGK
jgi:hypothetical protein